MSQTIQQKLTTFISNLKAHNMMEFPNEYYVLLSNGCIVFKLKLFENDSVEMILMRPCIQNEHIRLPFKGPTTDTTCAVFETKEKAMEMRDQLIELVRLNEAASEKISIKHVINGEQC